MSPSPPSSQGPLDAAYNVPCLAGETNVPAGCDPTRIKPCSAFESPAPPTITIGESDNTDCGTDDPMLGDTIEQISSSENQYLVKFTDKDGNCFAIEMSGGECW